MLIQMTYRVSDPDRRGRVLFLQTGLFLISMLSSAVVLAQAAASAADPGQSAAAQPVSITLEEAIHRAQANEPGYAAASADSRVAALDRSIARSALLPGITYHNQYLYTQGTGLSTPSSQGG